MDYQLLYRQEKQNAEYWRNLFYQVGGILFPESNPTPKEILDKAKDLKNPSPYCEDYFNHDIAVSILLNAGVLFCSFSHDYSYEPIKHGEPYQCGNHSLILMLDCSDVFAWGCSDAEGVHYDEVKILYDMWAQDKKCGATKWACVKRNEKPQFPIAKVMKESGSWDETMEKLPENKYDEYVRKEYPDYGTIQQAPDAQRL